MTSQVIDSPAIGSRDPSLCFHKAERATTDIDTLGADRYGRNRSAPDALRQVRRGYLTTGEPRLYTGCPAR